MSLNEPKSSNLNIISLKIVKNLNNPNPYDENFNWQLKLLKIDKIK